VKVEPTVVQAVMVGPLAAPAVTLVVAVFQSVLRMPPIQGPKPAT
jgi:hypothetical protein